MKLIWKLFTGLVGGMIALIQSSLPPLHLMTRRIRRSLFRRGRTFAHLPDGRLIPVAGGVGLMLEEVHVAKGIDPVADAFAGADQRSDVYDLSRYQSVIFLVYIGVGATGTSTIVVNSCDDNVPTTRTAMRYFSRDILTTDVQGAITERAAAGYIPAAGSSKIVLIEVLAADLADGDSFVEIEFDESVNDPVLGGVCGLFFKGRYKEDVSPTVLS